MYLVFRNIIMQLNAYIRVAACMCWYMCVGVCMRMWNIVCVWLYTIMYMCICMRMCAYIARYTVHVVYTTIKYYRAGNVPHIFCLRFYDCNQPSVCRHRVVLRRVRAPCGWRKTMYMSADVAVWADAACTMAHGDEARQL